MSFDATDPYWEVNKLLLEGRSLLDGVQAMMLSRARQPWRLRRNSRLLADCRRMMWRVEQVDMQAAHLLAQLRA